MISFYKFSLKNAEPLLNLVLSRRLRVGKEDPQRLDERKGLSAKPRPEGSLIWVHGASVGEAQSALILIQKLLDADPDLHILMTTGTLTSAALMEQKLPARAFHQFYPLDHPRWVEAFLDHWAPDMALWMESELWPCMLGTLKDRNIPAALINARMSERSFKRWSFFKKSAKIILSSFNLVLAQSEKDAQRLSALGAQNISVTDNLKYSARPLPYDKDELQTLSSILDNRPVWLYASTHKGEEEIACRVHERLKARLPNLLTILVPRHPERRDDIRKICEATGLSTQMRGAARHQPLSETDIYIADTLGELGLFYRLAPVACIGRSLSDDGGGGHNPIEAAQLDCAILHGPHVQYQKEIFDEMRAASAAIEISDEQALEEKIYTFLSAPEPLKEAQDRALNYAQGKTAVIDHVMAALAPLLPVNTVSAPKIEGVKHAS